MKCIFIQSNKWWSSFKVWFYLEFYILYYIYAFSNSHFACNGWKKNYFLYTLWYLCAETIYFFVILKMKLFIIVKLFLYWVIRSFFKKFRLLVKTLLKDLNLFYFSTTNQKQLSDVQLSVWNSSNAYTQTWCHFKK